MGMVSGFLFWGALDSAFLADFKGGPIFLEPAEPEPSEPDFETEPLEPEPDDFETVRNRTEPELPVVWRFRPNCGRRIYWSGLFCRLTTAASLSLIHI